MKGVELELDGVVDGVEVAHGGEVDDAVSVGGDVGAAGDDLGLEALGVEARGDGEGQAVAVVGDAEARAAGERRGAALRSRRVEGAQDVAVHSGRRG